MQQMLLGINFFGGKPSFIDKKGDEESRFGELSTKEIQEITDPMSPK